jgi:signal peptidase II
LRRLLLVAALVLAGDLATKIIVNDQIPLQGQSISVIGDLVQWTHVKNSGSAFGIFQGGRYFFIAFSLVSIGLIAVLAATPRYRSPRFAVCLGLILGGALGNLIDRIAYGAVTDWIDVGIGMTRWPTFNVADIGISLGVVFLAILLIVSPSSGEGRFVDGPDVP